MVNITIDDKTVEVPEGITVIQACELAGVEIPRFCYHEKLSIAGNCRMCLVEMVGGPPKPIASCATQVGEGMVIKTKSDMVQKAQKGVMELLLINHPLDCPICDQGGECDLQDQAFLYGKGESRFEEGKRAVEDKYMGPLIKTQMTRCIHCTRCVRFMTEVAGTEELGLVGRGEDAEVTTYIEKSITSELSGNIIDLCPVGALTSKPYAFKARPWELTKTESIDVHDALGSNIRIDSRGREVMRILPVRNDDINEEWISDKTRFAYDGLKMQRLDRPYLRKKGKLCEVSWDEVMEFMRGIFQKVQKDKLPVAGLAGDLADVESVYMLKTLLEQLGSKNYDCRPEGSILSNEFRSNYIFNSGIKSVEEADLFLLVGVNPRHEAALLNGKISYRVRRDGIKVGNIGQPLGINYPYDQLSSNPGVLDSILSGKHEFSKLLASAKKPMIIVGEGVFGRGDAKGVLERLSAIMQKYDVITDSWFGYNVLHNAAGRVGALDLGFVPEKNSLDTRQILDAAEAGSMKLVFLLSYDQANVSKLKNSLVVYIGSHGDLGAKSADVILPAAAFSEKTAIYVNTEGRVQQSLQAVVPPGEAITDWLVINKLLALISDEAFKSGADLHAKLFSDYPIFAKQDEIKRDYTLSSFKGYVARDDFSETVGNFYLSNPISRASLTMAKCAKELKE